MIYGNKGVFFLSTGRAGTETIYTILKNIEGISSHHEPHPLLFELGSKLYQNSNIDNDIVLSEIHEKRKELWSKLQGNVYIETSPQVTFVHEYFSHFFNNCKYCWVIRDPIEFINSGLNRDYYLTNSFWDKNRLTPKKGSSFLNIWPNLNQVSKILWLWTETNRYIYEKTLALNSSQFYSIRSQDIFNNTPMLYKMLSFIKDELNITEKNIENILRKKINKNIKSKFQYKTFSELNLDKNILSFFNEHCQIFT